MKEQTTPFLIVLACLCADRPNHAWETLLDCAPLAENFRASSPNRYPIL
jgi:hypothetical protein